jgi:hypothetical protein
MKNLSDGKKRGPPRDNVQTAFPTFSSVISWSIVADALHSSKSKALNRSAADTSPEPDQRKPGVWLQLKGFPSIGDSHSTAQRRRKPQMPNFYRK